MATDGGADGLDPLPPPDDFDDVLPLLDDPDFVNAEEQPACNSFSANGSLLYWPGMLGNYYSTSDGAPSIVPQPNGLPVHGDPSTSTSTAAARQADVLDCSGVQVLREVVHSNGLELMKLRIHGDSSAELFYHATLEVYRGINSDGLTTALVHQSCIEGRDYEWVRCYLTNYALQRAAGNYAVVRDTLFSEFHDVLCTTMNPAGVQVNEHDDHEGAAARNGVDDRRLTVHDAAIVQPVIRRNKEPEPAGPSQPNHTTDVQVQRPLKRAAGRIPPALQRERTGKMQFHNIAPYFHLPIVKAAEKLDIGATALKKICRRVGVPRWPHRKVKELDRQITNLRRSDNEASSRDEIEQLNADRNRIFHGPE